MEPLDLFFLIRQISKITLFFLKNSLKNVLSAKFEILWLGAVIELISSFWKVIAACADSYILLNSDTPYSALDHRGALCTK